MLELHNTARALKNIPIFSNLSVSVLKLITFASERITFDDQEIIFKKGDLADSAFFIEEGKAQVMIEEDGQKITVSELEKYDLFGEMALFLRTERSATIRARGKIVALKIDGDMFLKMVTENPIAALGVMTALSEKVINSSEQIAKLN